MTPATTNGPGPVGRIRPGGGSGSRSSSVSGWVTCSPSGSVELELDVLAQGHALASGLLEQLDDRAGAGDLGLGLELEPRHQHERPLGGPRVRQAQVVFVGPTVAHDDEVDVEGARLVALAGADAAVR